MCVSKLFSVAFPQLFASLRVQCSRAEHLVQFNYSSEYFVIFLSNSILMKIMLSLTTKEIKIKIKLKTINQYIISKTKRNYNLAKIEDK